MYLSDKMSLKLKNWREALALKGGGYTVHMYQSHVRVVMEPILTSEIKGSLGFTKGTSMCGE